MKTRISLFLALAATAAFALAARTVSAQDSAMAGASQNAPVQLSYGVMQIVQLAKANVSDGTIVSYIHNSANSYALDADQIVYLKQQGVSDNVINTMLNQPRQLQPAGQAMPAENYSGSSSAQASATVVQPAVVQTAPSSSVYVVPDSQSYNYYASSYYAPYYYPYGYGYYGWPALSLSFGFGGGYYGGYYRGGWGGYHGWGGGYHGWSGGYHGSSHGGGGWHH